MKAVLKKTLKIGFRLLLLPLYLWFELLARLTNEDSIFQSISQYLSLIPGKLGIYCRAAFYWWACPDTSDEIAIGFLTLLSHRNTTIRKGVYIGPQCNIGCCTIGEDTLLGSGVHILSGKNQHNIDDLNTPIKNQGGDFVKICIGNWCWLGNNVVILSNVGDKTVVAAGTVLTKTFEESTIIAGNPGKLVRKR